VYDGRLVIDSQFHTNDITVRAAGSISKFQRKYYADELTHARFNSLTVGHEVLSALFILLHSSELEISTSRDDYFSLPACTQTGRNIPKEFLLH